MAELQTPDILGAYLRGQNAVIQQRAAQQEMALRDQQLALAPLQQQAMQQGIERGGLELDQLRIAIKKQNALMGLLGQATNEMGGGQDRQNGQPSNQPAQSIDGWQANYDVGSHLISPATMQGIALLSPEQARELREQQEGAVKSAQIKAYAPGSPLPVLEAFAQNPQAGKALLNNPQLLAGWAGIAQKYGYNPQDMSDINVRRVATLAANDMRQQLRLSSLPIPEHYTTQAGPLGAQYQVEDTTGKATQLRGEESLHAVVGPDGKPTYAPASQAVGRTPFNQTTAATTVAADDPNIANHYQAVLNGNETMQQVPAMYRNGVAAMLNSTDKGSYSPQSQARLTLASSRITQPYTKMSQYELTANGLPYLERIDAALKHPGSVSDQDLLDSLTKLNTGGNAVTEAQVSLITHGKSWSDTVDTWKNKLKNGGVLSENQRQQIHDIANDIFTNYQKGYQPVYEEAAQKLTDAGIPKAFWTIPDLNNLAAKSKAAMHGEAATGGAHPPDIQALIDKARKGG